MINKACNTIYNSWYINCVQVASVYKVLFCQLQRWWNGGASKNIRAPTNKALKKEQKNTICKYINRINKINMCTCPQMILKAANYLIWFKNCIVGYYW